MQALTRAATILLPYLVGASTFALIDWVSDVKYLVGAVVVPTAICAALSWSKRSIKE